MPSQCCSHSTCTTYTADPSGLCPGHRPYPPLDQTPRYAPDAVLIVTGGTGARLPVESYHVYPPGAHPPNCPIAAGWWTVLECRTAKGSRWYGVTRAYINSELRMVVEGTDPRDAVRMGWDVVPVDRRV